MTGACLDTLEVLFGSPGPFGMVSAVQLRPEPTYWLSACADGSIRQSRVLQALRHLPRPLILYVTKVEDASYWLTQIRNAGFARAAIVTGQTSASERARVIRDWQADALDLIIATSAFGLGMDKADVKAVLHACIPEHIDRFYQEVGRGGRDGKACVSLVLYTPDDRGVAADLNQKAVITVRKGYERWEAMFRGRQDLDDGRSRVRVDVVPSYGFTNFENNSYNVSWNVRTLTLLARAGIIEIDAQPPPGPNSSGTTDGREVGSRYQSEMDRHRNERVLRILNEGHLDFANTWEITVEASRRRSDRSTREGLRLMFEVLDTTRCVAEVFADAYQITPDARRSLVHGIFPSLSCGGCPGCRSAGRDPFAGRDADPNAGLGTICL